MKALRRYVTWLAREAKSIVRPDLVLRSIERQPAPQDLRAGVIYMVQGGGTPKWAIMRCPCGCGEKLQLSLNPIRRPRWMVHRDRLRRVSLHPSVRQTAGCFAHFWVRHGIIEWCHDSGSLPAEG
ncbi:DUF6527 family protein [Sphingomonas sp.]|uniref:DUF6527 family protein n=1 Tax=Sphingomonas sp. TaxID=28214 RepID=UPI003BA8CBE4